MLVGHPQEVIPKHDDEVRLIFLLQPGTEGDRGFIPVLDAAAVEDEDREPQPVDDRREVGRRRGRHGGGLASYQRPARVSAGR